jgi:3-(3-hydroxy-phenyl)propionate hydroxylase
MKFLKQPHYSHGTVIDPGPGIPAAAASMVGRSLPQPLRGTGEASVPLDEMLPTGWAFIDVGPERQLTIDDGRGHRRAVTDLHGTFDGAAGLVLLVRPDRYVAGVAPSARRSALVVALANKVPGLSTMVGV